MRSSDETEMGEHQHPGKDAIVLVTRPAAWGLPTACPSCLPSYAYLKLARVAFNVHYDFCQPDSDDIPFIEFGDMVAFSSEHGGIRGFLKSQQIVDLDADFSESEIAEMQAYESLITSYLENTLLYELWVNENQLALNQIYYSALPWPVNKILSWKQQRRVTQRLGIGLNNRQEKAAELYRRAAEAYQALSVMLGNEKFFMKTRPSSLDALFLGHAAFVLKAPLEDSPLREELLKHANLVSYAESLESELLKSSSSSYIPIPACTTSRSSASTSSGTSHASARTQREKQKEPKERTEKERAFRRRAKYFLGAQVAAIIACLIFAGATYVDVALEDDVDED